MPPGGAWYAATRSVETPHYDVVRSDGHIQLRRYPEMTLAEVTRAGTRRDAVQAGFRPLARYIFAKDRPGTKLAMTAPVVQRRSDDAWRVAFILPAGTRAADAPTPMGDVRIVTEPARTIAAIRFSGVWTDTRFAAAADRLHGWIENAGLNVAGPVEYGYYDDPFTPAFLRRNEVMVPVADADGMAGDDAGSSPGA